MRKDILEVVDSVQPYTGTPEGQKLSILCDLDAIDKHRHLLVHVGYAAAASTAFAVDVDPTPSFHLLDRQLTKDGQVVLKVTYDRPRAEPDPNLEITPFVIFGEGMAGRGGEQSAAS